MGGYYANGRLYYEDTFGGWWGGVAYSEARRYRLRYDGSNLYTRYDTYRHGGLYVRCVSEEKTVTDLTYLQDMTGEIANNTLDGTTANSLRKIRARFCMLVKQTFENFLIIK